ncbi:MAG: hypothetical protein Q8R39_03835 [bacterium]|nr:hypothetical protein [bacterium]MDZ4284410.1 hypothetical protein [Patescibacteria group bacterium]
MSVWRIELDEMMSARIEGLARALGTSVTPLVHELLQSALRARNQTEAIWLKGIDEHTLGTGLFIIPDVMKGEIGAVQKIIVPDLTYEDCVRRGQAAIAFKWVPHTVQSYEDIMKST